VSSRRSTLLLIAVLALATTGCKLKVEATVNGPTFDSTDKVSVKVVGTGGADLTCDNDACEPTKLAYSGQSNIDVKVPAGDPKLVTIKLRKGLRTGSTTLDLSAGGTGETLKVERGAITCVPSGCRGRLDIAAAPRISLEAPAGSTSEVGGE
jgi:hypothetical protein